MASIRAATLADAQAISRVHVASWRAAYRGIVADAFLDSLDAEKKLERWQRLLVAHRQFFVAEENGELLGFVHGGALRDPVENYEAELYAIYLHPTAQKQGVGRSLFWALAGGLREDGYRSMLVWVLVGNSARQFYERMGGVQVAEAPFEIGGVNYPAVALGWRDLKAVAEKE